MSRHLSKLGAAFAVTYPWNTIIFSASLLLVHCGSTSTGEESVATDASVSCERCVGDASDLEDGGVPPDAPTVNLQRGAPSYGGCKLFPDNHILNTSIETANVHARSAAWISNMRALSGPHPGAGASALVYEGSRGGIPVNLGGILRTLALDGSYGQPTTSFSTIMPAAPRIEGEPSEIGAWDKHVLVVDPNGCHLNEHINYRNDILRGWLTGASVTWDLGSYAYATPIVKGGFGAEAASLPMAPLIYRYDEVEKGEILHPIRFASNSAKKGGYVWPARSSDGPNDAADAMPMGARLRLKSNADITALGPQARVVAKALSTFGAILADTTGGGWGLCGEGDPRWDDADLGTISKLDLNDFEVVDTDAWRVSEDSMEARIR